MRSKRVSIMLLSLLLLIGTILPSNYAKARTFSFSDIDQSFAYQEIITLANKGIVQGYGDGTFKPFQAATRSEMAVMSAKALSLKLPDLSEETPEIHPSWAARHIFAIMNANIVEASSRGWSEKITREEMVLWAVRMLELGDKLEELDERASLSDVSEISDHSQNSIWLAQQLDLIPKDLHWFYPRQHADRQSVALILHKMYFRLAELKAEAEKLINTGQVNVELTTSPDSEKVETISKPNSRENGGSKPIPQSPGTSNPPKLPDFSEPPGSGDLPGENNKCSATDTTYADSSSCYPEPEPEPQPEPEPPIVPELPKENYYSVAEAVYVSTKTISPSYSNHPVGWKINFKLLDATGDEIPETLFPPDLNVTFKDDHQVFAADGSIAKFYNIPDSGLTIKGDIQVTSDVAGYHLSSNFEIAVVSTEKPTEYLTVSVLLEGIGSTATRIDEMETMRSMLASIDPELKVTWAMNGDFVFWETQRPQLAKVLEYVDTYGDEVGIIVNYPNNKTMDEWEVEINSWLYMYRYNALNSLHVPGTNGDSSVWASMPEEYRPKSLSTFGINPEQAAWLKGNYQISSFIGWPATQYNVGQLSGEGSPLMPYYSHINNPIVPAQSAETNSGMIFMNTATIDPIGSRYTSGSSRWTLHPADPYVKELNAAPQLHVANQYINNPFRGKNTVNYLSLMLDTNWILRTEHLSKTWVDFVNQFPNDVEVKIMGIHQFSEMYKGRAGADNSNAEFTLLFRGSGYTAVGGENSPADLRYLWTETATERIILSKQDLDVSWKVVDFTDYTVTPIEKLPYTTHGYAEDISFVTGRNFKLSPTAPLTVEERHRIDERLAELQFTESILYD